MATKATKPAPAPTPAPTPPASTPAPAPAPEATIRELNLKVAAEVHARNNPPPDPPRDTYDFAAQIAAANPATLADARRLRKSMIEGADSKAAREAIAAAWSPVIERLRLVE
jgi:hypothetical protein